MRPVEIKKNCENSVDTEKKIKRGLKKAVVNSRSVAGCPQNK